MADPKQDINQHANADVDKDRTASDVNLHTPFGALTSGKGNQIFTDEKDLVSWFPGRLPPVLDIVDGNAAPSTEVDGDVYVLEDDIERDVDTILFQSGNTIRAAFNDSFALPAVGDFIQFENATNAINNGSFLVTALPGAGAVDFTNPLRSDLADDELSDSPATSKWTFVDWDGARAKDWVKFDAAADLWRAITPQEGNTFYNKTTGTNFFFGSTSLWIEELLDVSSLLAMRSGIVLAATFAGNPKTATVTFTTPFSDAVYSIGVIGEDQRSWYIQSKVAASFIINTGSNTAPSFDVMWTAIKSGEFG